MNVAKYLKNREVQESVGFIITPEGKGFYLIGEERIPMKEFEKANPIINVTMKDNCDRRNIWYADEVVSAIKGNH